MALPRPTILEISSRMIADVESRLTEDTALLPIALLRILCIAFAIAIHVLYGALQILSVNLMPDTKDLDWLKWHGKIWGVKYKEASFSYGVVRFTGTEGTGIPQGTLLQREDTGVEYETLANGTITGGFDDVNIKAVVEGESGNYLKPSPTTTLYLQLVSPIVGIIDSTEIVGSEEIDGGNDAETPDEYSLRILQRIQRPGAGGSEDDYERWALEVTGVDKAWVYPSYWGAGTCGVVISPDDSALATIVQTYINKKQPVTANQPRLQASQDYVYPYDEELMDYWISINPNDTDTQNAIIDAIDQFHKDEGIPGGVLLWSHLQSAIASTGVYNYEITAINKGGVPQPLTDITFVAFEYPVLSSIGFSLL